MDRLCLNAQCSLITTKTWCTPYFYYFFDDKVFVSVEEMAGIFTEISGDPISTPSCAGVITDETFGGQYGGQSERLSVVQRFEIEMGNAPVTVNGLVGGSLWSWFMQPFIFCLNAGCWNFLTWKRITSFLWSTLWRRHAEPRTSWWWWKPFCFEHVSKSSILCI